MTTENYTPVLACNMTAIAPELREQHSALARHIFSATLETQELPNGYAFRLPAESDILINAAKFIANERLCCPFFNFVLEVIPEQKGLWMRLTGGQGVKEFIKAEIVLPTGKSL